jgi:hypothetical protein
MGDLISEGATLIDSLANTIADKTNSKEIDYDFVIQAMLVSLAQLTKIQKADNTWPYEEEIDFRHELEELRAEHGSEKDFIDIDTSGTGSIISSPKKKAKERAVEGDVSGLTGIQSMDDFIIDSRVSSDVLDLEDLKAIRRLKKK